MAGLGYKDFTAGAVLTAAQVDGYLMEQAVMNFAGTAARGSALSSVQAAGMMAHVGGGTVTVYDGSAWQQVYPASAGLTFVAGTAFSAVASVSINNCFTSTYENYKIIGHITGSVVTNAQGRLRVGGVDNSGATAYTRQRVTGDGSTAAADRTSQSNWLWWTVSTTDYGVASIDVFRPNVAARTMYVALNGDSQSGAYLFYSVGMHDQTVAYDGFSIIPASGTITGTVRVYGYRNS